MSITETIFIIIKINDKVKINNLRWDKQHTDLFLESHPHLPFVYKKDSYIPMLSKESYEFMGADCTFPAIKTNNRGHLNGPNGNRNVTIQRPPKMLRISTLGDSVSANYVQKKGINYNFSLEIENQLTKKMPNRKLEVNNCSIGGYTTLDILIKFLIKDIHENPQIIILNHGYSNIRSFLAGTYESDHTHFRKSFSVGERRYKVAQWIPFKNLNVYSLFLSPFLPTTLKDFLKYVSVSNIDINNKWEGLDFFERNLENIIYLAKSNHITVLLCTCPHFLHDEICNNYAHRKFHEGMEIQNNIIREVAKKHSILLADNEKILEKCSENFIDSIHLGPEGMKKCAATVVDIIAKEIAINPLLAA